MGRSILTLLVCVLFSALVHAEVPCPELNTKSISASSFHILTYIDIRGAVLPDGPESIHQQLRNEIDPTLADIAQKLNKDNKSAMKPRVSLVVCDLAPRIDDMSREDLMWLQQSHVIVAVWRSKGAVTYLAFPYYESEASLERGDAEVTLAPSDSGVLSAAGGMIADDWFLAAPVAAWVDLFQRNRPATEMFVALGLASVLSKSKEFEPAWITLCIARTKLAEAAKNARRPPPREVQARFKDFIDRQIDKTEKDIRTDRGILRELLSAYRQSDDIRRICASAEQITGTQ